jgi:allantoicase
LAVDLAERAKALDADELVSPGRGQELDDGWSLLWTPKETMAWARLTYMHQSGKPAGPATPGRKLEKAGPRS